MNMNLVIPTDGRERACLPGVDHLTLAGGAQGLSGLSIWQQSIDAGEATPPHRHDCEEVVVVSEGSGVLELEGVQHAFSAPCTLVVPRNAPHQILNTGSGPLRLLAAFSVSPVQAFFPDGSPIPLPWAT
ncbi:MAG TPA: cupin domain-containing protein [Quisquiliibacterium sp.]|nr:cupin domain-containing protein [Quisquiliibacterium sp.]